MPCARLVDVQTLVLHLKTLREYNTLTSKAATVSMSTPVWDVVCADPLMFRPWCCVQKTLHGHQRSLVPNAGKV